MCHTEPEDQVSVHVTSALVTCHDTSRPCLALRPTGGNHHLHVLTLTEIALPSGVVIQGVPQ